MMEKIKTWIIHRLGGLVYDDMPIRMQQDLLNYWCNKTIDKTAKETLEKGFDSKSLFD